MRISNIIPKKLSKKKIIAPSRQATVVIDKPELEPDKSRFFKTQWKEDRRQFFFK